MLHVSEANQHQGSRGLVDECADLVADLLDVRFIQDVAVNEFDLRDRTDLRDFESRRLSSHGGSVSYEEVV